MVVSGRNSNNTKKKSNVIRKRQHHRNKPRHNQKINLGTIFDEHLKCEFEKHDVEATMKTMVKEPPNAIAPSTVIALAPGPKRFYK